MQQGRSKCGTLVPFYLGFLAVNSTPEEEGSINYTIPYDGTWFEGMFYPDELIHTDEYPFCSDATCPCHEDRESVTALNEQVEQGLLTFEEATQTREGVML